MPAKRTTPQQRPIALYDGHCKFCTAQARKLAARARGAIEIRDFQQPGVLDALPGLAHDDCMRALQLVDQDGRVYAAAEAVVRALRLGRPVLGRLALVYYVPGVRQLAEAGYRWVARNRYRLFGRSRPACDEDACMVHFRAR